MEDSMFHSSVYNKTVVACKETTVDEEEEEEEEEGESGWTSYFEDFSKDHRDQREEHGICSSSFGTPSMVSDAASFPEWKSSSSPNYNQEGAIFASSSVGYPPNLPRKLTFKKTIAKEIPLDDSLEDTASSPVNSPKLSDLRTTDHVNPRKSTNDYFHSSLGKEGIDERCEMKLNGKNECADLQKRELCLVPLSMLVNYLG